LELDEGLEHSDIIFIMVQTPNSGSNKFYDHSIVSDLLQKINDKKVENKHIIIGCTLMPKYIDEVGSFLLSDCKNTTLSYNPEFIAQGEIIKGFLNPDMILIGTISHDLEEMLREIYSKIVKTQPKYCILSPLEAEITKITINGFITTKLSFANMISDVCDTIGANKEKVLDSIGSDSRIGNKYFRPGYSFGGPCFPRDTRALALFVEQNNINNELLLSTTKYNQLHSDFLTQKLLDENKDEYIIENVCYKEDSKIPIIEESAKLQIAKKLVEKGKKVIIKDEIQLINEVKKEYGNIFNYIIV
jgi:nucleotide sugar dehydrogenase